MPICILLNSNVNFMTRNTIILTETPILSSEMEPEDAKYHLDRCIKSGLWCPGGNEEESDDQDVYEDAKE